MMEELFLTVLEISMSVGAVSLLLFLLSPLLGRRYEARWSYLILVTLALRLVILYNWSPIGTVLSIHIPNITSGREPSAMAGQYLQQLSVGEPVYHISRPPAVLVIWLLGCLLVLGMHLFSYLHYRRKLIKGSRPLQDSAILRQLEVLRGELGLGRKISLLQSDEIASPMAMGFLHPLLVLPCQEYTEKEQYFILRHELVHLKRGDLYVRLLFVAAEAVHWFNPLVWFLQRQAVAAMELACDEQVVRGMGYEARKDYSEALLSIMTGQNKRIALSTYFSGGTRIMKERFLNIMSGMKKRNGLPLLCLSCAAVLAVGALVAVQAKEPETSDQGTGVHGVYEEGLSSTANEYLPNEPMVTIEPTSHFDDYELNTETHFIEEQYIPNEIDGHLGMDEMENEETYIPDEVSPERYEGMIEVPGEFIPDEFKGDILSEDQAIYIPNEASLETNAGSVVVRGSDGEIVAVVSVPAREDGLEELSAEDAADRLRQLREAERQHQIQEREEYLRKLLEEKIKASDEVAAFLIENQDQLSELGDNEEFQEAVRRMNWASQALRDELQCP